MTRLELHQQFMEIAHWLYDDDNRDIVRYWDRYVRFLYAYKRNEGGLDIPKLFELIEDNIAQEMRNDPAGNTPVTDAENVAAGGGAETIGHPL